MALKPIAVAIAAALAAASTRLASAPAEPVTADPRAGMYALSRSGTSPIYLSWLQPSGERDYQLLFAKLQSDARWSRCRV